MASKDYFFLLNLMSKLKVKSEPNDICKPNVKADLKLKYGGKSASQKQASKLELYSEASKKPSSVNCKTPEALKRTPPKKRRKKRKKLSAAAKEALRERLAKPIAIAKPLAHLLGVSHVSRAEAVSRLWDYIRSHGLKDKEDGRVVVCDDALKSVFGGVDYIHILAIPKLLSPLFKVGSNDVPSTSLDDADDDLV